MAGSSLKSFIKDVRGAKTLAEERSIITKASAKIRTKLRDDHLPLEKRRRNIQKLLYLYILGEKTHFGQVECINLIASDDFADKRLGYLAATLLLDESQDLLTLLTNLLNNDLNHPNKYVVSLALTTLGSLGSTELARDLYLDVENILNKSKDPYIVKKALQCVAKLITKDFTLIDIFDSNLITNLLGDHAICTHGTLLGINKVLQSILLNYQHFQASLEEDGHKDDSNLLEVLVKLVPDLLTILQSLSTKNFEPEYDVQGTCDPFLQCTLLYTLRLFFQQRSDLSNFQNKFNDLLTQIATYTDGSKNCGQAILYETARTIFSLNLEQPLRVLGINILAKFLSQKENNTKYVALNTLLKVVDQEPAAVQRHRRFISKCLRDPDISIRKRALELSFAILDEGNLVELVNELTAFLGKATDDDENLIVFTVENLVKVLDTYSVADEKWKLGVLFQSLKLVGTYLTSEIIGDILIAINNAENSSQRRDLIVDMLRISLDSSKNFEISEENSGWSIVAIWCIGEYADDLLETPVDRNLISEFSLTKFLCTQEEKFNTNDKKSLHYILTASLKLSSKITDNGCIESLRQIILNHTKDPDLMIQNKSVQYEIIFRQSKSVKKVLLDTMPKFEKRNPVEIEIGSSSKTARANITDTSSGLLDLGAENEKNHESTTKTPADLLADLFSSTGISGAGDVSQNNHSSSNSTAETLRLPSNAVKVHDSEFLEAYFLLKSLDSGSAQMDLYLKARDGITDIKTFSAVSKTQKLTLGPLYPSDALQKDKVCRQNLKITGSGKLKLRTKLDFKVGGSSIEQQFDYKFDQTL